MEWGSILYSPGYLEGPPGNTELVTGGNVATSITSSATPNGRPASYSQLWNATPFSCQGLLLGASPGGSSVRYAVEIGIGASGQERNIIQDFCFAANSRLVQWFYMPVRIPEASRIGGRLTANTASQSANFYLHLVTAGVFGLISPGRMYALGVNPTSGAYGIDVTTNVSAHNTTWNEVVASCPADIRALNFGLHTNNSAPASQGLQVQVGVGAVGSEVIVLNVNVMSGGGADQVGRNPVLWLPCSIKAGQRIATRVEGNSTADLVTVSLYGLG